MDPECADRPKVSVLVITYNQQGTIARTLESILAQQTNFSFEIEIADDCSGDRTGDICREFALQYPTRIRYTRNRANLGVRANYFNALRHARAEYIADCAGDDYWVDENKLQKQADLLDAHPEVGLVHTAWCYCHEAIGKVEQANTAPEYAQLLKPLSRPGELLEGVFTKKMLIHFCSAMFRKSIFLEAERKDPWPFQSEEITFEDFQLAVIYARDAYVAYIPDITLYYTVGHESFTQCADTLKEFDFIFSLLKLKQHYIRYCGMSRVAIRRMTNTYARFLYSAAFMHLDMQRIHAVDHFYKANAIHRPMRCRLMHHLAHIPGIGHTAARLKKAHHEWKLKKWS